ncbi:hypothetical protein GH714_035214 [Hevea brasiliensis]|uniref:non-specific serine/threonine protein kinase n=1 Tax=Hevea brasiliensis TaxID=3981 RepID=A0A6A6NB19_HEVBR|nr:hypothetical protein GH714_035214 [Hevea brasiliensis]
MPLAPQSSFPTSLSLSLSHPNKQVVLQHTSKKPGGQPCLDLTFAGCAKGRETLIANPEEVDLVFLAYVAKERPIPIQAAIDSAVEGKLAAFEKKRNERVRLAIWAVPLLKQILDTDKQELDAKNCKDLFDLKLKKKYDKDEMIRMIYCVAACVYKPTKLRPQMSQVLEVLKGNMEPKNIWVRNDGKYLYEGSPYASLPTLAEETPDS